MYDDKQGKGSNRNTNRTSNGQSNSRPRQASGSQSSAKRPSVTSSKSQYGKFNGSQQIKRPKGSVDSTIGKTPRSTQSQRKQQSNRGNTKNVRRSSNYNDGYNTSLTQQKLIEQQRQEIREKASKAKPISHKKIKFIHIITYCSILLIILAIGTALSLTVLFKSEYITVEGETRYATDDIVAASNLSIGENIFLADKKSSSQAIVNKFPYVEKADVGFKIPNVLNIKITEASPAYLIGLGKQYLVISAKGRILDTVSQRIKGVPVLVGPKLTSTQEGSYVKFQEETVFTILMDIVNCLEDNKFKNLVSIDISNTAQIKLNYDDRISIILGFPEEIDYKIRTAMTIINDKLDPNKTGTIKGELDVSSCNTTKKSYFNEETLDIKNESSSQTATSSSATATTLPTSDETVSNTNNNTNVDENSQNTNNDLEQTTESNDVETFND